MKRSKFLRWLVIVPIAGIPLVRWALQFMDQRDRKAWDRDIKLLQSEYVNDLRSMARALLPSVIGPVGADSVAVEFTRWLALQRPDAELNHLAFRFRPGESSTVRPGTTRALITGSNYVRQIEQLRSQARPRRFAQLDRIEMSVLLMSALQVSGARDIPPGPGGANILLDLLSFFYRSPRAVDVFHERSIGALSCRGLEGVDRPPAPLTIAVRS